MHLNEVELNNLLAGHLNDLHFTKVENIVCTEHFELKLTGSKKIVFSNCIFKDAFLISPSTKLDTIRFSDCSFEGKLVIYQQKLITVQLHNCKQIRSLNLSNCTEFALSISDCVVENGADFAFSQFSRIGLTNTFFNTKLPDFTTAFHNSVFDEANFIDCSFQNIDFNFANFKGNVYFENCKLQTLTNHFRRHNELIVEGELTFISCNFNDQSFNGSYKKPISFLGCDGTLSLSDSVFDSIVYFNQSFFSALYLSSSTFKENASFVNTGLHALYVHNVFFLKNADFSDAKILKASREVYRLIKNELTKANNKIEADIYQQRELLSLYEEVKTAEGRYQEKIILWFYKVSNNFGTSWVKGVQFTLVSSIISFALYVLTLQKPPFAFGWFGWTSYWEALNNLTKHFFHFFIVTHSIDFMDAFAPNAFSYFLDSLSRIFIGYGIFQTVTAFRRFGKS